MGKVGGKVEKEPLFCMGFQEIDSGLSDVFRQIRTVGCVLGQETKYKRCKVVDGKTEVATPFAFLETVGWNTYRNMPFPDLSLLNKLIGYSINVRL